MPVYCITGANRGLGLEFVRQLSKAPSNLIIACTRLLQSDLSALKSVSDPERLHIVECDTGSVESIRNCASQIQSLLADKNLKVDVLINNAGINMKSYQDSLSFDPESLLTQVRVNIIGPAKMVEFLNAASMLSTSVRVVNMTSGLGSMTESLGAPGNTARKCCTYSISKAGLNMLAIHQSGDLRQKAGLKDAIVIVMDPGWVKTAMGGPGAMLEPEESIGGMLKTVEGLKDSDNGAFFTYTGKNKPW